MDAHNYSDPIPFLGGIPMTLTPAKTLQSSLARTIVQRTRGRDAWSDHTFDEPVRTSARS